MCSHYFYLATLTITYTGSYIIVLTCTIIINILVLQVLLIIIPVYYNILLVLSTYNNNSTVHSSIIIIIITVVMYIYTLYYKHTCKIIYIYSINLFQIQDRSQHVGTQAFSPSFINTRWNIKDFAIITMHQVTLYQNILSQFRDIIEDLKVVKNIQMHYGKKCKKRKEKD